ncbi:hypothetical protein QJS10_CPB11g00437 [Acorus calamus]|uniref:Uncharacterized protein n=1 Tax=Acorus calamus TaxID=4465 RepID=A0AAV9DV54_ACOCL|nr:hypothetical protein QJS10_CPB11g00437 [Acorus calamus]
MSDAMKQGPPSSKQVFKGPPSTQQTSKGSFNILQADKGDYNDANKFSILNECLNTDEPVMANIESSECPFISNEGEQSGEKLKSPITPPSAPISSQATNDDNATHQTLVETTALPNFGEQAQIRLIPSDPISENSEIHYEGNTIIDLTEGHSSPDNSKIVSSSKGPSAKGTKRN